MQVPSVQGASLECAREILKAGTTDEALAVLDSYGILKETMAVVNGEGSSFIWTTGLM